MAEQRETVTWEELAWSSHIAQEAIVRVLVRKGLVTQKELLDEVKRVQREYAAKKA